jgi:hypothetical protein
VAAVVEITAPAIMAAANEAASIWVATTVVEWDTKARAPATIVPATIVLATIVLATIALAMIALTSAVITITPIIAMCVGTAGAAGAATVAEATGP